MTRSPDSNGWSRVARRIRVPLGFIFAVAYVWLSRPTRSSLIAGGLLLLPGLLLRGLASGHVQKNEQLATSGPYAYTRNPLYLGSLILAAGFAVAARSWWVAAITVAIFIIIYVPVIAAEERFLRQTFPEYEDYAHLVPRLWPRLTPFPGLPGSFSPALYRKHREYNALLGCVAVVVILVLKLVLKVVW
ncbi:MAG: isoprenylcysteine carboxylmethyltransferase family protein [Terriglobales bacterium]